jgi:hypothetical protein
MRVWSWESVVALGQQGKLRCDGKIVATLHLMPDHEAQFIVDALNEKEQRETPDPPWIGTAGTDITVTNITKAADELKKRG